MPSLSSRVLVVVMLVPMSRPSTQINFGFYIEENSSKPGYYYIKNAKHEGYRLAKWGSGDGQTGVYNGQYHYDQLWRFQKEGDLIYYRIYNRKYSSANLKIAMQAKVGERRR